MGFITHYTCLDDLNKLKIGQNYIFFSPWQTWGFSGKPKYLPTYKNAHPQPWIGDLMDTDVGFIKPMDHIINISLTH